VDPALGPVTVVSRRSDALWRDTPGAVLVLGSDDDVICIEGAGRLLWLLLDEPTTVAELVRILRDEVPGGSDAVDGLEQGIRGLADLGLVDLDAVDLDVVDRA
jgi:hypothetical protein